MQIEEKVIPEHVKDEQEAIKEFRQELFTKNLRLFYVSNIFSPDYSKFIINLVTNFEQVSSAPTPRSKKIRPTEILEMNEEEFVVTSSKKSLSYKLFEFIATVYFTTILRTNDKQTQQQFFQWLVEKMEQVIKFCIY
jgi:hypothetical protein